jgi:hypothetical protein
MIFCSYNNPGKIGNLINEAVQWYPTKKIISKVENLMNNNATHLSSVKSSFESGLKIANFELDWFNKYSPIIIKSIVSCENTRGYRLPDNVIPSAYAIHLTPFIVPNNFTFNGAVKILANVVKSTRKIVLHADQLTIKSLEVYQINDGNRLPKKLTVLNVTRIEKYHFLNIMMEAPIKDGANLSINIAYKGFLNTEMRGFFRSSYKINNQTRYIIYHYVSMYKTYSCSYCSSLAIISLSKHGTVYR